MHSDLNMLVPVQVDPYLFVHHLQKNATYEEIREFIIAIDEIMEDWDFTLMLHAYFEDQYEKYMEENDEFGR